jgi:prepilin-type N-terminal cleavage/methylation domain-containing protein
VKSVHCAIADRRRRITGDSGLTLSELMVTLVLMGIVGTLMMTAVVNVTRTVTKNQANADSLDIARIGMNRITKTIRAGMDIQRSGLADLPALASVSPNQLTVYASVGAVPAKVTYSINGSRELIEQWYAGNAASNPYWTFVATPRTTIVARKIPAGSAALFVYLDEFGDPIANQTTNTVADLELIRSVRIELTVDADPARGGGPVTISNTVVLPNLGIAKR